MSWQEIEEIRLGVIGGGTLAQQYRLIFKSASDERKLIPKHWISDAIKTQAEQRPRWSRLIRSRSAVESNVRQCSLVKALEARGVTFEKIGSTTVLKGYDLSQHSGLKGLVAAAGIIAAAAALGWASTPYAYAGRPPYTDVGVFFVAGLLIAELFSRTAPAIERTVVSVMFAAVIAAAAFPVLLVVNAWTATDVAARQYEQTAIGQYRSLDPNLPDLSFTGNGEFWGHFPAKSLHEFLVSRGPLGFYQYDQESLYQEMRDFYAQKDKATETHR
jgi:hypothetical protein